MRCVTLVRNTIQVNGESTELVVPTRGIWQRDLISPYLFLLCNEGLACLLQQKEAQGALQRSENEMADLELLFHTCCLQMMIFSSHAVIKEALMPCMSSMTH
jgi:hypothetical protein